MGMKDGVLVRFYGYSAYGYRRGRHCSGKIWLGKYNLETIKNTLIIMINYEDSGREPSYVGGGFIESAFASSISFLAL